MLDAFAFLGADLAEEIVIRNTHKLNDLIEPIQPFPKELYSLQDDAFQSSLGVESIEKEVKRLVFEKVSMLYGNNPHPIVTERLQKELKSIIDNSFAPIYYISHLLVKKSLEDGYLVGSRGSVGSSFVATMLDITEVNPLRPHYRCPNCQYTLFKLTDEEILKQGMTEEEKPYYEYLQTINSGYDLKDENCPKCHTPFQKDGHDIPFETFLGFDGDKVPDIDLNFSGDYQSKAHAYVRELLGEEYTFRAGTIQTVAERNAFGYVKGYLEDKHIEARSAQIARLAKGIEGVKRSTGQHPGGIIVVPKNHSIYDVTPIQYPADDTTSEWKTTHFDYHSIEENLLKLDLLGHDDPTMIRMLYDLTGYDPQQIPLDDKATMSLFTSTEALGFINDPICGNSGTFAVPEFGTRFVREMLSQTKPTTFDELIRISGLSHGTDVWLNNGQDIINSGTATLKEIIAARDDIMLYLISKGIDRKLSFTIMESVRKGRGLKPEWETEMKRHDVPEWYIESCKKIKYMFPKAHAAAYVLMAFRIAWYKVHYPKEFYTAYFSIRANSFDAEIMTHGIDRVVRKIKEIESNPNAKAVEKEMMVTLEVVYEFYKRGFTFDPIDLYLSDAVNFIPGEKSLRPPFTAIPGLGETAARDIVSARENGKFLSAEELSMRCPKVSKTVIELLRSNGVLQDLPDSSQVTLF